MKTHILKTADNIQCKDKREGVSLNPPINGLISPLQVQRNENKTGMPDNLKSGIESLSGMDMSDVKVHYNSSQPAQLNAHAYAQGNQIHLASGQEKHLPHEAWHVVQQKQGRVKPTMQMKGKVNISINDAVNLEEEATAMGSLAINSNRQVQRLRYHTVGQPVLQGIFGYDTWGSVKSMAGYVGTGLKDSISYGVDGVKDLAQYSLDGLKGSYNQLSNVAVGSLGHVVRGLRGVKDYVSDGFAGTKDYLHDGAVGTVGHLRRLGPIVRNRAINQLPLYLGDGTRGTINYAYRGVKDPLRYMWRGANDAMTYTKDGVLGGVSHGKNMLTNSIGYGRRGVQGGLQHAKRGVTGIKDFGVTGAQNLYHGLGYFRTMAMALGLGTSGVAAMMGLPLPQLLLAFAGGASVPYLKDFYHFLRLSSNYEPNTPGYHSIERHSAWHSRSNLKKRLKPLLLDNRTSKMKDWSGWLTGKNVASATTSSQFLTSNWHRFAKAKGIAHLKTIHPGAVLLDHKPNPQAAGGTNVDFTIQFPNWYTGISHTSVTPPEGQAVSFVYFNFIRPRTPLAGHQLAEFNRINLIPAPARTMEDQHNFAILNATIAGNAFFLVQHYPTDAASGSINDAVDTTKWPI